MGTDTTEAHGFSGLWKLGFGNVDPVSMGMVPFRRTAEQSARVKPYRLAKINLLSTITVHLCDSLDGTVRPDALDNLAVCL